MSHSRVLAALFAAALSMSAVGSALATDSNVTETLTITTALSVSGVPASIDYGTVVPGAPSAAQSFLASVSANVPWKMTATGSDFTSGTHTLVMGARQVQVTGLAGASTDVAAYTSFGAPLGTSRLLYGGAGPGSGTINLRINAPGSTIPGVYTGDFTLTLVAS